MLNMSQQLHSPFFSVATAQTWCRLVQDYQSLHHHLEAVEANIPTAGLVEESEERLVDRISLYQVCCDIAKEVWFPQNLSCLTSSITSSSSSLRVKRVLKGG